MSTHVPCIPAECRVCQYVSALCMFEYSSSSINSATRVFLCINMYLLPMCHLFKLFSIWVSEQTKLVNEEVQNGGTGEYLRVGTKELNDRMDQRNRRAKDVNDAIL